MTKDQKLLEEAYRLISEKKEPLYKVESDGFVRWLGEGPDLTGAPEVVEGVFFCRSENLRSLRGGPKIVNGGYYCSSGEEDFSLEGAPEVAKSTFCCSDSQMKNLKGGPKTAKGNYHCKRCRIESLEGSPISIGGDFICIDNNLILKSLKGGPRNVFGNYNCSNNKLESLEGSPEIIHKSFYCSNNRRLRTLKGGPRSVQGCYFCSWCNLESLEGAPEVVGGEFACHDNPLKSLRGLPKAKKYTLPERFTEEDIKQEFKRQEREKILNTIDKETKDTFGDLIENI